MNKEEYDSMYSSCDSDSDLDLSFNKLKLLGRLSTDPLLREVLKAKTLNKINPMPGDTGRIFSRSEGSSPLPQILGKHLCCEPAMKIISTKRTSADSKYRCAYGGHSSTVILTPELKCILKERIRACKDKSDFSKLESKYTEDIVLD